MTNNIRTLIIRRVACIAIPQGGDIIDGLSFLGSHEAFQSAFKEAEEWVKDAILKVRDAEEPNQWKASSDEEIAGEILKRCDLK